MKKITLNEELTRIQEMMGVNHTSPSGKETNMSPEDDDYEINYGKDAIKELSPSDIVNSMREEEMGENESIKPIEITVELTNKFKEMMEESKNTDGNRGFHATDSKIKLYNNGNRYNLVKVGTIPYDVKRDLQFDFWASYRPNANEIYVNQSSATAKDLQNSLLKDDSIPSTAGIVSKLEPGYYCKFENGFNVGEEDSRGYFKIVGDSSDYTTFEKNEEFDPSDSDGEGLSDCCGAPIVMHDICSECGEHCEAEEEYVDEIPGFEGTRDALDDLGIREEVDEESAIGGWDLAMESIDELQKELEEEEGSWMAMRAGKDGKVFEGRPGFQQETYFETQAGALESAEEYAASKGYVVNFESMTPEHVAYGQTVKYSVELMKDGVPARKMLQISLYRMESGKYELTNYIN